MESSQGSGGIPSGEGPGNGAGLDPVVALLLSGAAATVHEAEALYLDAHLAEVVHLAESPISEEAFREHPLIALLLSHGSRPREDSLR